MDALTAKLDLEKAEMEDKLKAHEAELAAAKENQMDADRIAELEKIIAEEKSKN